MTRDMIRRVGNPARLTNLPDQSHVWFAGGWNFDVTLTLSRSIDGGVTWHALNSHFDGSGAVQDVGFNGSLFVAVGYNLPQDVSVETSTNSGFTASTTPPTPFDPGGTGYGVAYSDTLNLFVVVGQGGSGSGYKTIITSSDGAVWTARPNVLDGSISVFASGVAWSPSLGMFAAIGNNRANPIVTSLDGVTWIQRTTIIRGGYPATITWGNGMFVACGVDVTLTVPKLEISVDGITWTAVTLPSGFSPSYAFWDRIHAHWIVTGISSSPLRTVYTTPEFITWTGQTTPIDGVASLTAINLSANGTGKVILGTNHSPGDLLVTEDGGVTWDVVSDPVDANIQCVRFFNTAGSVTSIPDVLYYDARVTQVFAEVPVSTVTDDNARISQVFMEVPVTTVIDDNVRVSQVFIEVPVA